MSRPFRGGPAAAALCTLALSLVPVPLRAAGFALFEHGAKGMGFAGAFTAQASDPSAIFHNPAGIAFLRGKQIYLGATGVMPKWSFEGANPFPGTGVTEHGTTSVLLPPAVYYTQPFSARVVFGVGLNVPFGLKTEWANPDQLSQRVLSVLPAQTLTLDSSITFPAFFSGGVAYHRGDWVVEADVNWYQWSAFKSIPVTFPDRPDLSGAITENYSDSFQYRFGV